jgi:hypothetical protein
LIDGRNFGSAGPESIRWPSLLTVDRYPRVGEER